MTTPAQRKTLAWLMDYTVQQNAKIHYPLHDVRTQSVHQYTSLALLQAALATPQGATFDCSQGTELLGLLAGLSDMNGLNYRYDGYTGTILNTCKPHYTRASSAMIGALCVFGPDTGEHVAMVREPGPNPLLWSHGQESGPYYIRLITEAAYHKNIYTFCSIAHL